jgi:hypothetical protein
MIFTSLPTLFCPDASNGPLTKKILYSRPNGSLQPHENTGTPDCAIPFLGQPGQCALNRV